GVASTAALQQKEVRMARTITRWDPFSELADMRTRFDRLLSDLSEGQERAWTPAVDVVRENGHLVVRANVPGIKPDEIEIKVVDDVLTISGEHEETKEETDKQFVRRERRFGAFSRSMPLPKGVDPKQIDAKTDDGVLEVTIPLPKEAAHEPVTIKAKPAA
ncbi:MAG: Hsp20/alpha crystallin family protein, partial [Candidatus Limnocylindria bacterium]